MKVSFALEAFSVFLLSALVAAASAPPKTPPDVSLSPSTPFARSRPLLWLRPRADSCFGRSGPRRHPLAQAFTPSPITNTSHASILTGLLPGSHGVTDFAVPLNPSHPTVAELVKKQNYHTAAFIGRVILDSKTLAPGFDRGLTTTTIFLSIRKPSRAGGASNAAAWMSCSMPKLGSPASSGCALRVGAPLRSARSL